MKKKVDRAFNALTTLIKKLYCSPTLQNIAIILGFIVLVFLVLITDPEILFEVDYTAGSEDEESDEEIREMSKMVSRANEITEEVRRQGKVELTEDIKREIWEGVKEESNLKAQLREQTEAKNKLQDKFREIRGEMNKYPVFSHDYITHRNRLEKCRRDLEKVFERQDRLLNIIRTYDKSYKMDDEINYPTENNNNNNNN